MFSMEDSSEQRSIGDLFLSLSVIFEIIRDALTFEEDWVLQNSSSEEESSELESPELETPELELTIIIVFLRHERNGRRIGAEGRLSLVDV